MARTALAQWQRQDLLGPFFQDLDPGYFNRFFGQLNSLPATVNKKWTPAVDIRETDTELVVHVDVPGAKKEDLTVEILEGVLTLSGERRRESEQDEGETHRVERFYGKFTRSFRLPKGYASDDVKASYTDGVLEVRVPKIPEKEPKAIPIA